MRVTKGEPECLEVGFGKSVVIVLCGDLCGLREAKKQEYVDILNSSSCSPTVWPW